MAREHLLKTWPEFFGAVWERKKLFEVRRNDRLFRVGDTLVLAEFDPKTEEFSGRRISARVSYILDGERAEAMGLKPGYCVMDIEPAYSGRA